MSIQSFIKKVCVQTAVYWEHIGTDEQGDPCYAPPIEIKCRWDGGIIIRNKYWSDDPAIIAEIITPHPIKANSIIRLGELFDIPSSFIYPKEVEDSCQIKTVYSTPLFKSSTEFVYEGSLSRV